MAYRKIGQSAVVMVFAMSALLCGCRALRGAKPVEATEPPKMEASRATLMVGLEQNALKIRTLRANAQVEASNEAVVVPATPGDNIRRMSGKEYGKKFESAQVNGLLALSRGEQGARNMRFSGSVIAGPSPVIMLLGRNDAFWISLPNIEREKGQAQGTVFMGTAERVEPRRDDLFSIRPQDFWDLFFTDEVFMPGTISYMETWPDFYVLNFLRQESPERIFSKIWFDRRDLSVAVHQIFDGAGSIIAEARFATYKPVTIKGTQARLLLPTQVLMLWPRDRLVLNMTLTNVRVNEDVSEKVFTPEFPPKYKVQPIEEIPRQSATVR